MGCQPGTHMSDISTLHSICQTSTKCQFLIAVFLPLGKLFLCLLVSCVGVVVWGGVATCPVLTQISPAQGRGWGWPPSRTRAPKSRTSTGSKTVKVFCKDNIQTSNSDIRPWYKSTYKNKTIYIYNICLFRVIFIFLILVDLTLESPKTRKGQRRSRKQKARKSKSTPNRKLHKLSRLVQNDQPRKNLDRGRRAPYPRE